MAAADGPSPREEPGEQTHQSVAAAAACDHIRFKKDSPDFFLLGEAGGAAPDPPLAAPAPPAGGAAAAAPAAASASAASTSARVGAGDAGPAPSSADESY